jgi:hypothetical protein
VFIPAMSLGALLYISVYTLIGYFLGQPALDALEGLHLPVGLLGQLIPLGIIVFWTIRARQALRQRLPSLSAEVNREPRLRAGAVAGLLATISSTLLMNVILNLAGNLAFRTSGTIVEQTAARLATALAREVQPLQLFVAVVAFLMVGVLWGALYGLLKSHPLVRDVPDWLSGLRFAVIPLLVSLLVALPLLGLGFLGVGATGPVALAGEVIRHAAYGVLLGLIYPVLVARRSVRLRPHTPAELDAVPPGVESPATPSV